MILAYTGAPGKLSQATLQTFRVGAIEAPIVLQRQSWRGTRTRIVTSEPEELGVSTVACCLQQHLPYLEKTSLLFKSETGALP